MRVLVTGSRAWTDAERVYAELNAVYEPGMVVVHGAARGADRMASDWAKMRGVEEEPHHADWDRFGKRAGFIRNWEMVKAGADLCLAFPLGESRGTRSCMKLAQQQGIPLVVVVEEAR